ncbi:G3E family GTPase [Rhizobium tibeticum]|uniref:CobW family GTP-binding protein n=1 Tax=Rhizobium tibeticum TaxID=501024 RepID=UPI002782C7B6|nr:GTP-binding protein [Rhizobium tibeticum]MDP9811277.1 G3E family GTPase [Rhizobium tibeticum]
MLTKAEILNGDIDPKKYYPPDVYREPNKDYPRDYTIDVREMALVKAKQAQTRLSEKAAQIQAVIDAIEGVSSGDGSRHHLPARRFRNGVVLGAHPAISRASGAVDRPHRFLGAGKTTLLNRILNGGHGLRVAVLVNDFGSINIDAELVVGIESDGDVINFANGCVCCNIRDDLVAAVTQVMARPEKPGYILLEASGVADPSGIALTFMNEDMRDRIRLDSIMCVMDAEQIFAAPGMMELKLRQVAFADMLILNKVDLVTPEEIERIKAWLDDRFHRYRLVHTSRGNVPLEILLSVGRFDPSRFDDTSSHDQSPHDCNGRDCEHGAHGHRHDHSQAFTTWSYETDAPLSLEACGKRHANCRPASTDAKAWYTRQHGYLFRR